MKKVSRLVAVGGEFSYDAAAATLTCNTAPSFSPSQLPDDAMHTLVYLYLLREDGTHESFITRNAASWNLARRINDAWKGVSLTLTLCSRISMTLPIAGYGDVACYYFSASNTPVSSPASIIVPKD